MQNQYPNQYPNQQQNQLIQSYYPPQYGSAAPGNPAPASFWQKASRFLQTPVYRMALLGLGVLCFILAMAGTGLFAMYMGLVLLAAVLVTLIPDLVRAIKTRRDIAVTACLLVGAVCFLLGTFGAAGVRMNGGTPEQFDMQLEWMRKSGTSIEDLVNSAAMFSDEITPFHLFVGKIEMHLAVARVPLLWIGVILILIPLSFRVWQRYTGKTGPNAGQEMAAQAIVAASVGAQKLYQSAQRGVKNAQQYIQTAQQQYQAQQAAIRPDRCCICGKMLTNGFAPLFTAQNGQEARIDQECWNRINIIYNSPDGQQISQAASFFMSRMGSASPEVLPWLQSYLDVANSRLSQSAEGGWPQQ